MNNDISTVVGSSYSVDFYGCRSELISHVEQVEQVFLHAARESLATVLGWKFHQFEPHGVSGVILIAESHFTVHTWPEGEYAAVGIFTCGTTMSPEVAIEVLKKGFEAKDVSVQVTPRGY